MLQRACPTARNIVVSSSRQCLHRSVSLDGVGPLKFAVAMLSVISCMAKFYRRPSTVQAMLGSHHADACTPNLDPATAGGSKAVMPANTWA